MSKQLTQNAINSFDAMVKHAYQGTAMLRNTVRTRTNVKATSHRFPKMGKGMATVRIDSTDVIPMNIGHTNRTATLGDWNAAEYTGIFDQAEVNYEEKSELAMIIAAAIGRREDQMILDAAAAAATTQTVATGIGGAASDLNTAKIRRAKRLMDAVGIPKMGLSQGQPGAGTKDKTLLIRAVQLEALLGDPNANTIDQNAIKILFDGEISHWIGFEVMVMEDRAEGGLPTSGGTSTAYAYHRAAIGFAIGLDFRTEVNYVPHKTSWLSNGIFKAGAVDIDADGIVEITSTDT